MMPRYIKSFGEYCTLDVMEHVGMGYSINYLILIENGAVLSSKELSTIFIETKEEAFKLAEQVSTEYDENIYDCYKHYEKLNPKCWDCVFRRTCKKERLNH